MEREGVTHPMMQLFSRHTNVKQLAAYVGDLDGAALARERAQMQETGEVLAGRGPAPVGSHARTPFTAASGTPWATVFLALFFSLMTSTGAEPIVPSFFACAPPHVHRNDGLPGRREIEEALTACGLGNGLSSRDWQSWPLHVKKVPNINLERLRTMARRHGKEAALNAALRPLLDPTFYAAVADPNVKLERCRYTAEDLRTQLDAGYSEELPTGEIPLGTVRKFPVPEPTKIPRRRRDISHTLTANDVARECSCVLPTNEEKAALLFMGSAAVAFDVVAAFNHFLYDVSVRNFFCFLGSDGKTYRLRRLAMGQTHACDLCQLFLDIVLCEVAYRTCIPRDRMVGYIDNGLVVIPTIGHAEKVEAAVKQICEELDVLLNPIESGPTVEFTGLVLDFVSKTLKLSNKTVDKARVVADALALERPLFPVRLLSAGLGIVLYAHSVFRSHGRADAALFPELMAFFRSISIQTATDETLWDKSVHIEPNLLKQLVSWLRRVETNSRCDAIDISQAPSVLIACAACSEGWGAVATRLDGSTPPVAVSGRFTVPIPRSTASEPLAVTFALEELHQRQAFAPSDTVVVATDHAGLVWATGKGHSACMQYNECIARLRAEYPTVRMAFIPGLDNPADPLSRGLSGGWEGLLLRAARSFKGPASRLKGLTVRGPPNCALNLPCD